MKVSSVQPTAKFHSAKQTVRSKPQKAVSPELTERHLKAPHLVKSTPETIGDRKAREAEKETIRLLKNEPESTGEKLEDELETIGDKKSREAEAAIRLLGKAITADRAGENAVELVRKMAADRGIKLPSQNAPNSKPVDWGAIRNGVKKPDTNRQIQQLPSEKPNPTSDATVKADPKQVVAALEEETNLEARNQEPGIKQKSPNIQRIGF
jgi:hypothetical protein